MKLSSLKEEKFIVLLQEINNFDEINYFFISNCQNKIGIFGKFMSKVSMRWKNWSDFKDLHSTQFQKEDWWKIEILSLNSGKIQELQNEINCMNDSRYFQDAESARSGQSHITGQPVFFPPPSRTLRSAKPFFGNAKPQRHGPPSTWDTHGSSGNVWANPTASSSALYSQESDPRISNVSEHTSPHVMSDSQTPVQDQRCQWRPSARKSVIPSEGRFSKNYGADQQRLQISDLHFDKFPTLTTFACWKMRFKTEVCSCSQFPT